MKTINNTIIDCLMYQWPLQVKLITKRNNQIPPSGNILYCY